MLELPYLLADSGEEDSGLAEAYGDIIASGIVLVLDEGVKDILVVLDTLVLELVLLGGTGVVTYHAMDTYLLVEALVGVDETRNELVVVDDALGDGRLVVLPEFIMDVPGEDVAQHEYVKFLATERLCELVVLTEQLDVALLGNLEVVLVEVVDILRLHGLAVVHVGNRKNVVVVALDMRLHLLHVYGELVRPGGLQFLPERLDEAALLVVGGLHVLQLGAGVVQFPAHGDEHSLVNGRGGVAFHLGVFLPSRVLDGTIRSLELLLVLLGALEELHVVAVYPPEALQGIVPAVHLLKVALEVVNQLLDGRVVVLGDASCRCRFSEKLEYLLGLCGIFLAHFPLIPLLVDGHHIAHVTNYILKNYFQLVNNFSTEK